MVGKLRFSVWWWDKIISANGCSLAEQPPAWILVLNTKRTNLHLSYPKKDRLPYKTVEGKKIARCELVYCSNEDTNITTCGWNNNEQIMTYEEAIIL